MTKYEPNDSEGGKKRSQGLAAGINRGGVPAAEGHSAQPPGIPPGCLFFLISLFPPARPLREDKRGYGIPIKGHRTHGKEIRALGIHFLKIVSPPC